MKCPFRFMAKRNWGVCELAVAYYGSHGFLFLWLQVADDICDSFSMVTGHWWHLWTRGSSSVSMVTGLWWRLWLCFYGYRSLMTFVNAWLLNNPQFQVIRCETVERRCQKSGEFDPDKTSYHTPSGGAANFVIILRYEQNQILSFFTAH